MRLFLMLCTTLLLSSCLTVEPLKLEKDFAPKILSDEWEISDPETEGFDLSRLEKAYDLFFSEEEGFRTAISLIVIRNGKIVAEGYCRNEDDYKRLNNIKSATKSVTSILFGIAIQEEKIDSNLNENLHHYFPEYTSKYPDKNEITVHNILTMQSGIEFSNQIHTGELLVDKPESSLDYILSKPIAFEQGSIFDYHDGNSHLMGAIIQTQTEKSLADYARAKLFNQLGIQDFVWEQHRDGLNYGAFGLYLKPRDFAKFGQLILNSGEWNGNNLIEKSWIEKSVTPISNINDAPYGLQWWIRQDFNAFSSAGHGGQYTYIIPEKDLLIVYTAEPTVVYHEYGTDFNDFEKLVQLILDSIN